MRQRQDHDRLYASARWRKVRAFQLAMEPLCVMCEAEGIVRQATIADHVVPHRGNLHLFWNGRLQSLCKPHHDGDKQRMERGGKPKPRFGSDGWPVGA